MRFYKVYLLMSILSLASGSCKKTEAIAHPSITIENLPNAQAGKLYNQSVASWVSGGTAPYTWSATGLPSGFSISTAGVISSSDQITAGIANIILRVEDKSGKSATATVVMHIITSGGALSGVDLAQYAGASTYTSAYYYDTNGNYVVNPLFNTPVDPVANRNAISYSTQFPNNAVTKCLNMTPQGQMYNSSPGIIMIGIQRPVATSYVTFIDGSTLNTWNLPGTTFRVAPNQPVFSAQVGGTYVQAADCLFSLLNATAPNLTFNLDGNAENQNQGAWDSSANNYGTTASPFKYGWYAHGIRLNNCGATTATVRSDNMRGVVGSSGFDAQNVARTEVFNWQKLGQMSGTTAADNVIYKSTTTLPLQSASGAVWQSQPATATWYLTIDASDTRHGMGCFQGGNGFIKPGSVFNRCGTAMNIEAGYGPIGTQSVTVGDPALGADQIIVTGSTSYDMVINCNSEGTMQVGAVTTYGVTSTGSKEGVVFSGTGVRTDTNVGPGFPGTGSYSFTDYTVVSPTIAGIDFFQMKTLYPPKIFLTRARIHNTVSGAVAVKGANVALGGGTFVSF